MPALISMKFSVVDPIPLLPVDPILLLSVDAIPPLAVDPVLLLSVDLSPLLATDQIPADPVPPRSPWLCPIPR